MPTVLFVYTTMKKETRKGRFGRAALAMFVGFVLLGMLLPSTGGNLANPHPGMWRWGGFCFFPEAFFAVITIVPASMACTVLGIVRESRLEVVGWSLFGLIILFMTIA